MPSQLHVAANAGTPVLETEWLSTQSSSALLSAYVLPSTQLIVVGKAQHIKTNIDCFTGKIKLPGIPSMYPLRAGL